MIEQKNPEGRPSSRPLNFLLMGIINQFGSRKALAYTIGADLTDVSKWVRGVRRVPTKYAHRIERILNLNPAETDTITYIDYQEP